MMIALEPATLRPAAGSKVLLLPDGRHQGKHCCPPYDDMAPLARIRRALERNPDAKVWVAISHASATPATTR